MQPALTIIKDEHRALAAVLRGLQYLVQQVRNSQKAPDFALMKSMLAYIEAFPDKLHHPKEDQYLYRILRERTGEVTQTLNLLEEEHRKETEWLNTLRTTLEAYERQASAFEPFSDAVEFYVAAHFSHMNKEEDVIMPVAEKALTEADWNEIATAFRSNQDPLVGTGTQREFRDLFRRIVNLMPAPMGLGPEQS
ncbi:MAG: hemerythrin domain-containing protein [Rhodocyclaceae bacterium]|nr:hemerythrin domain-containing protein [Rhodocyclaceae bacterium]MBX3667705.1 hemerythrin domain-containing protein [Rhodocyclaceae bacterium]